MRNGLAARDRADLVRQAAAFGGSPCYWQALWTAILGPEYFLGAIRVAAMAERTMRLGAC